MYWGNISKRLVLLSVLLFFILPLLNFPLVEKVKLEKIGFLDLNSHYFDLEAGDYAYRPNGHEGIAVFNIKDKTKPVKLGDFPIDDMIIDVQKVGSFLYASSDYSFYVIDISNQASPVLKGKFNSEKKIKMFGVSGNYAYLWHDLATYQYSLFSVIDIARPMYPILVGNFEMKTEGSFGEYLTKFIINGQYAIANTIQPTSPRRYEHRLVIADLRNPSAPVKLGEYYLGSTGMSGYGGVLDFAVSGSYVFLAHQNYGLQVLDISNPFLPKLANEGDGVSNLLQLERSGNLLFARQPNSILIFNITNPQSPAQIGSWASTEKISNIKVSGNHIGIEYPDGVFRILDVSSPANPTLVREGKRELANIDIRTIKDNIAYIEDANHNTKIVDISSPAHPVLKSTYYIKSNPGSFLISGDTAFSVEGKVFNVIDISNKSNPVIVGSVTSDLYSFIGISGNYVFMTQNQGSGINGWGIIDISDKAHPNVIFTKKENADEFLLEGDYLYKYSFETLIITDVKNKLAPVAVGMIDLPMYISGLKLSGNFVYIISGENKLHTIDITNKSKPVEVSSLNQIYGDSMLISGNYLYTIGQQGIQVIDISNPSATVLKLTDSRFKNLKDAQISGNYLISTVWNYYVSDLGIYVFDIADPSSPTLAGMYDLVKTDQGRDISLKVQGNILYLLERGKLCVLEIKPNINPSIHLVFPNGWENIELSASSAPYQITWLENMLSGQVTIDLYKGGEFFQNIATVPAGIGSYSYVFPSSIPNGSDYSIRIAQGSLEDFSNDTFTINNSNKQYIYRFSQDNIEFSTQVGIFPAPKTVSIDYSNGPSTSQWTLTTTQPWLNVNPGSGKGARTIQISVDTAGLTAGTYFGSIKMYVPDDLIPVKTLNVVLTVFNAPPTITLDKHNLVFNSSKGNNPQHQTVNINCGGQPIPWSIVTDGGFLFVSPITGTGDSTLTVSVAPWSEMNPRTYTGYIHVESSFAQNTPQIVTVTVNVEDSGEPFGVFATPINYSTVSGSIAVTGWVLDNTGVESVRIYRDRISTDPGTDVRVFVGDATFVEGARPDVQAIYPNYPNSSRAGWGYMLLTNTLPKADNTWFGDGYDYLLYAVATDKDGHEVTLGSKWIIVDNEHATKPFGAIDTPRQGESIWDNGFWNFGWALTPQPNMIPIDGSTIDVIIDGKNIGHPTYNIPRSDVGALFPDYANSNGPGGYIGFDAIKLGTGLHTISWNVTDNAGNTDGIGSRYFTVEKPDDGPYGSSIQNETSGFDSSTELSPADAQVNTVNMVNSDTEEYETGTGPIQSSIKRIEIKEMERLVIPLFDDNRFNNLKGYSINGNRSGRLPVGSTLDSTNGIFYWLPGPGFVGEYHLQFTGIDEQGNTIKEDFFVTIKPNHM